MKEEIKQRIEQAVATWNEEKTVAQYLRNHLSEEQNGVKKIDKVINNIIAKATGGAATEENEIKYNELLFKAATLDQKPQNQVNQQFNFHDNFILKTKKQ